MNKKNLIIAIDHRSGIPIYMQIVEQVRQRISNGDLRTGDQLPTVRQMATDLRVNFNTVARAYRMLDDAGLISTQQGRGTYIWEEPPPAAIEQMHHETLAAITSQFLQDTGKLGFTPEEVKQEVGQQLVSRKVGDLIKEEYKRTGKNAQ